MPTVRTAILSTLPVVAAGLVMSCGQPAEYVSQPAAVEPVVETCTTTPPAIRINELLDGNDSVFRDESGDFDDWVELVNAGEEVVSLADWSLAEGGNSWNFPADVALDPGEHLLVWLDGEAAQGALHASFAVRAGEELELVDPEGCLVDALQVEVLPADVVQGRFPSGGAFVSASIFTTPGAPNPEDPGLSRDPRDVLFPVDSVLRLDLTLPTASYDALLADGDALVEAAIEFRGVELDPVQLAIKGAAGSERSITEKAAFRLNLDTFLPGQRLRGMEHITLNNMVQDPSAVHETVAYELMREAGIPAPRVAHVELWMNGEYRGLFLHVETIDDQFLQRWFAEPDGNLYEGAYGADVTLQSMSLMDLDEQGLGDATDGSELLRFAQLLDQPPSEALWPEFQARVDTERTLKMLAAEVVTQHWDGYFWYPNNYRIYHEPGADRWTLIPWGLDQTFGRPGAGIHVASGSIGEWCLQVPSCRAEYDLALWEMADRLLAMDVVTQVSAIHDRVVQLYEDDPLRESTPEVMRSETIATAASAHAYAEQVLAELAVAP